jgi:hypothetical protein
MGNALPLSGCSVLSLALRIFPFPSYIRRDQSCRFSDLLLHTNLCSSSSMATRNIFLFVSSQKSLRNTKKEEEEEEEEEEEFSHLDILTISYIFTKIRQKERGANSF